jgi:hypothetical protein
LLPALRLLQFPWRWLVVLQAPMAMCFASAVWFERRSLRVPLIAGCAALFVGLSFVAPELWFDDCGSRIASLQEAAREGIGVLGKAEYTPPGIRFPLVDFLLDSKGSVVMDAQGNPVLNIVPNACLLENLPETSIQADGAPTPVWDGNPDDCKSSGWNELSFMRNPLHATADRPEQKVFMGVAAHAGYLILRLRYYPAWRVRVNGIPVTVSAEQKRGLTAVPVPQGNVLVQVDWTTTGDVVVGRWVSGLAFLMVTGLFFFEQRLSRNLRQDVM